MVRKITLKSTIWIAALTHAKQVTFWLVGSPGDLAFFWEKGAFKGSWCIPMKTEKAAQTHKSS